MINLKSNATSIHIQQRIWTGATYFNLNYSMEIGNHILGLSILIGRQKRRGSTAMAGVGGDV